MHIPLDVLEITLVSSVIVCLLTEGTELLNYIATPSEKLSVPYYCLLFFTLPTLLLALSLSLSL